MEELAADISFALDAYYRDERRSEVELSLRASEERFRELAVWTDGAIGRVTTLLS